MSGRSCSRRSQVSAGEWVNTDMYQELLRQHVVSLVHRRYTYWWKICLLADLTLTHTPRTNQLLLAEFETLMNWLPCLLNLKLLASLSAAFCRLKSRQHLPLINSDTLHLSIAGVLDRLAKEYISKTCLSFSRRRCPILRKMKFEFNRWAANSLKHTNHYFVSGQLYASTRHEGLYIKKTFTIGWLTLYDYISQLLITDLLL